MIAQMTSKNGVRVSSSRAFLRPAQSRQNLHIMLNATVAKVLINARSKTAYGVEVIDAFGHTMKVAAKKEVIVAGGAVNSPQILMLSGIGPKEELTRVRFIFTLPQGNSKARSMLGAGLRFQIAICPEMTISLSVFHFFPIRLAFVRLLIYQVLVKISTITSLISPIST